jgi:hypothetical protein
MKIGIGLSIAGGATTVGSWVLRDETGAQAIVDADFANNRYWFNGASYNTYADFATAIALTTTVDADGAYRNSYGKLIQATVNTPRLDHDADGTPRGLALDGARINKVTARKHNPTDTTNVTLDNATNGLATLTVVQDVAALAAAGLDLLCTNGNVYQLDNSLGDDDALATLTTVGNTNAHSFQAFVRAGGSGSDPSLGLNQVAGTEAFDNTAYELVKAENITPSDSARVPSITAPAGRIVWFILPCLEEATFSSRYPIPGSTTASVTVSADQPRGGPTGGLPFTGFNASEGTFVVKGQTYSPEAVIKTFFELNNNATSERLLLYNDGAGNHTFVVTDGGAAQASITRPAAAAGTTFRGAVAYKANDFAHGIDGGAPGTDTTGTVPAPDRFYLGHRVSSGSPLYGHIERWTYFDRRISDARIMEVTADPGPFDVFLVIGQSNALAGKTLDSSTDVSGPRVFQWGRHEAGKVIPGHEPLQHNEDAVRTDSIGFAVAFAREWYVPNALEEGRSVLLVPAAKGGTGFTNGWSVGDTLYTEAIASANAALASHPENRLVGVFWQGGEAQADTGWTENQYTAELDAMIAGMRASITGAANVPFIVGGMVPGWVAADAGRQPVQDALADTPNRVANTGYADPETPTVLEDDSDSDLIHYGAADQRTLGERYWNALEPLL